ncbi:MAG: hypothetical protein HYR56_20270 [Acidobacteria bacterium]|nr:hypothetical protein [Acidobacteriota bacterium]MBI3424742.1 hypothetical protein [Acidobacteriota bacterium]
MPPSLTDIIERLHAHYGPPDPPPSDDPFELILWEQAAYLANDAQRAATFELLALRVGLRPEQILAAEDAVLLEVARHGGSIAVAERAARLRESARLVKEEWSGDLRNALRLPPAKAQRALQRFASIGAPGAEKILLFTHTQPVLALESNGLRVLVRLGFAAEQKNYNATYRAIRQALAAELPADFDWLIAAHQLLRQHGQELCKRTQPQCKSCPLRRACVYCQAAAG